MLSKFRMYESKLLCTNSFSKLIDIEYRDLWSDQEVSMCYAAHNGYKRSVLYSIHKGARTWVNGMAYAIKENRRDIIEFFISKGVEGCHRGAYYAAKEGHKDLVDFFLSKLIIDSAYTYRDHGMVFAAKGNHVDLVQYFIAKGSEDWFWGMESAIQYKYTVLGKYFISKLWNNPTAKNYQELYNICSSRGISENLLEFLKKYIS